MRPVVLVFAGCYLPGVKGGGPIRTIANMVDRLGDDFDFHVVTADRDLGDLVPYPEIQFDQWVRVGKAKVFYASCASMSMAEMRRLVRSTPHDVTYLNSAFSVDFSLKILLLRFLGQIERKPVLLAPRGEFSEGALALKSWKKLPFLWLSSLVGIYRDVLWQASSEYELADIKRVIGHAAQVEVAPNMALVPAGAAIEPQSAMSEFDDAGKRRPLRICFLSRISPMKNLDFALRVIGKLDREVEFSIYGPIENLDYWSMCNRIISRLPENISVSYEGAIGNSEVFGELSMHDIFFVPSKGENFGHVFFEALSAGVPILVSDRTPWRGLEGIGVGWDIPLEQEDEFIRAINDFAELGATEAKRIRSRCKAYAVSIADDGDSVGKSRRIFLNAIGRGTN